MVLVKYHVLMDSGFPKEQESVLKKVSFPINHNQFLQTLVLAYCKSLADSQTYSVTCFLDDIKISCKKPPENTTAEYKCIDFYENQNLKTTSSRKCMNKAWTDTLPMCNPGMFYIS